MATDTRHAAWQTKTYAVRLRAPAEPDRDLVDGLDDYGDAIDFAKEWLYRLDSVRDESTRLVILETSGDSTREVWSYPADENGDADAHDDGQELVKVFGFNPATWTSSVREFSTTERKSSLRDRISTAGVAAPEVTPPRPRATQQLEPKPPYVVPSAPTARPAPSTPAPPSAPIVRTVGKREHAHSSTWQVVVHNAKRAWADRVARVGLILTIVAFWLALVATDIRVLVGLLVGVPLVWYRLKRETDEDDAFDDWT